MGDPCVCEERARRIEELEGQLSELAEQLKRPVPPAVMRYLFLYACHLIDKMETSDEMYGVWARLPDPDKDLANHLVRGIFHRWTER